MDEFEVLAPTPRSVTVDGERREILPLTVLELPAAARICRGLVERLKALKLPGVTVHEDGSVDVDRDELVAIVLELIEHDLPAVVDLTAVMSRIERDRVARCDVAQFLEIVVAVFEVNRDFFVQRLAPLLAGLVQQVSGAGRMRSTSLSSAATR